MNKTIEIPNKLNFDPDTMNFLSGLQNEICFSQSDKITLDFHSCSFCSPSLISYIGALKILGRSNSKEIWFRSNPSSRLFKYFQTSGLYSFFTGDLTNYTNKNTIPFKEIHMDDGAIIQYIDSIIDLAPIHLTPQCRDLLFTNIYEIFNNSTEHASASHGVFACGHWMPNIRQLVFSVYDTGIGIPELVKQKICPDFTSQRALGWALTSGNSTSQLNDGVPRGIGLPNLKQFVSLNNGSLDILSNDVYYNYKGTGTFHSLDTPTIGTLIGLTIIADDEHIYAVKRRD